MNERAPDVDGIEALRCADCAASDSAAYDAVPVDRMPIPTEALLGFPDGVPSMSGLSRGRFLRNGLLGFASVYAAAKIPWQTAFEAAVAEAAPASDHCLVMLFLNGGNDGPNLFVPADPAQYAAYAGLRPTIARADVPAPATGVGSVPMTGTAAGQLALANLPGVTGAANSLESLWNAGGVALFPAADYPNPNFSHFTSRDWWFNGALHKSTTGWLGRWLDLYGSAANPLQAVSIGGNVSKIIRAARAPVSSVPETLGNFGFNVAGVNANGEVANLTGEPPGNASTARARGVYGQTVQVAQNLATLTNPALAATYPNSSLSRRLNLAATLLASGLTKIVTIDWGSFDTHGAQLGSQDPQLQVLGQALAAFQTDLATRTPGLADRVITCVFSEFGRRGAENASIGTDHGAGGPMMVIGPQVRGGLAGAPAPLTALVNGNLQVTTDFRSVYGAIISEWLGGDPGAVLPDGAFPLSRADVAGASLIL